MLYYSAPASVYLLYYSLARQHIPTKHSVLDASVYLLDSVYLLYYSVYLLY
jgi:hypothetical protein